MTVISKVIFSFETKFGQDVDRWPKYARHFCKDIMDRIPTEIDATRYEEFKYYYEADVPYRRIARLVNHS